MSTECVAKRHFSISIGWLLKISTRVILSGVQGFKKWGMIVEQEQNVNNFIICFSMRSLEK